MRYAICLLLFASITASAAGFAESSDTVTLSKKDYEDLTDLALSNEREPKSVRKSYKAILFGHNVTPTSYTLSKGTSSVGIYAVAYGVTDKLMLATSPWIDYDYNMYNVHLRYGGKIADGQRLTLFKTYQTPRAYYQQESVTAQLIHSIDVSPVYTLHTVATYMYYYDDTNPYSLRMVSFNSDPYEVIVSTLHEARLSDHFGICAEIGLLGLNYFYPYLHYGASMNLMGKYWMVQAGVSHTFRPGVSYDGRTYDEWASSKTTDAVHPEIHAQIYF
jgi:hypothetical protein